MSSCEEFHVTVLSGVPERRCLRPVCCLCVAFQVVLFHGGYTFVV